VDVKTDGPTTFPYVVRALEPLRAGGWLTTWNGTGVTPGAVTVIGTGNTPLDQVQGVSPRDYFFDGPLPTLGTTFSNITADVSPIASTDFAAVFGSVRNETLNATQMAILESQVATAHAKGIAVRYWVSDAILTREIWKRAFVNDYCRTNQAGRLGPGTLSGGRCGMQVLICSTLTTSRARPTSGRIWAKLT